MLVQLAIILLGFIALSRAADEAIKRLIRLSRHFGVSEFAISFIIVGIVSIFPELSIGLNSALDGVPSIGLGIILGSNVADLTLVIGTVALVAGGLKLQHPAIIETKWFLALAALPVLLLLDGTLSQLDGGILFAAFLVYLVHLVRHDQKIKKVKRPKEKINVPFELSFALASIAAIILAGMVITDAAEALSVGLSAPLIFIGTVLAVGTCLPELTFAIKAANHHHGELGVGDILGNVLADCLASLGLLALVAPVTPRYPQLAFLSGGLMLLSLAAVLITFRTTGTLSKKAGVALIFLYIIFLLAQFFAENMLAPGKA